VRAWQADGPAVFFGGDWIIGLIPHAGRDRPVKGQRHDQDQPFDKLRRRGGRDIGYGSVRDRTRAI
jgi:hypothetical protein